jgi:hypothetical protein
MLRQVADLLCPPQTWFQHTSELRDAEQVDLLYFGFPCVDKSTLNLGWVSPLIALFLLHVSAK